MHEPNLQNVPRDFNSEDHSFAISVRMAFVPAIGNIMLSADYCQLELRILAHFSKDATLCDIMRKPGDIFKNIAANWNHVSEDKVCKFRNTIHLFEVDFNCDNYIFVDRLTIKCVNIQSNCVME